MSIDHKTSDLKAENILPIVAPRRYWLSMLSMQPYGHALMSPSAATWIAIVRFIVLVMVVLEGLSWGFAASIFGSSDPARIGLALAGGLIVASVVLCIDALLVLLDVDSFKNRSDREHIVDSDSKASTTREIGSSSQSVGNMLGAIWRALWSKSARRVYRSFAAYLRWPILPIAVRAAMIIVSILGTAPLISMMALQGDIDHAFDKVDQDKIAELKSRLEQEKDIERTFVRSVITDEKSIVRTRFEEWQTAQAAALAEAQNLGCGPVCKLAKEIAAQAEAEYRAAKELLSIKESKLSHTEADAALIAFGVAVERGDVNTLRDRFGFEPTSRSFRARFEAMNRLAKEPGAQQTAMIVTALLVFVAIGLFIAKYYQPEDVKIYLSGARQHQWADFLKGNLDKWLESSDQSTNLRQRVLSPPAFCSLYDEIVVPRKNDIPMNNLNKALVTIRNDLDPKLGQLYAIEENSKALNDQIDCLESQHDGLDEKCNKYIAKHQDLEAREKRFRDLGLGTTSLSFEVLEREGEKLKRERQELDEADDFISGLRAQMRAIRRKITRLRAELAQSESKCTTLQVACEPLQARELQVNEAKGALAVSSVSAVAGSKRDGKANSYA